MTSQKPTRPLTGTGNKILDRLPADVQKRLRPDLELLDIVRDTIVHHPGEKIEHLYFPTTCMISITVTTQNGNTVEAGAVGSREVVGINAFMGGAETTMTEYICQLPGQVYKIAAAPLRDEFDRNTEMRAVMLKYTQALIAHISQNVACNRLHQLNQRCSRWLLEVRDRVQSDEFALTQEFIAQMLGADRVSVTNSMSGLKERGVIDYLRGNIVINDVEALKAESCECFFVLQNEYNRLLGGQ